MFNYMRCLRVDQRMEWPREGFRLDAITRLVSDIHPHGHLLEPSRPDWVVIKRMA